MGRSVLNIEYIKNMKLAATLIVGALAAPHRAPRVRQSSRIVGGPGTYPEYPSVIEPQNVGGWQNGYDFSDPAEVARFERDQMMKNKGMMKKSMPKKMVMPKKMGMQKKMVVPKKMVMPKKMG